jgi:hypothetical protein
MEIDQLLELHPRLFHMAQHEAWPGIKALGLMSTQALLDKFEISGPERTAIIDCRRVENVRITHPIHGVAVIRDNKPMSDRALSKCLADGLTPTDWYRRLNSLVFFWTQEDRLRRLLAARAYRSTAQLVIELDTAKLVAAHGASIRLSPINSGSTVYNPVPRGSDTFTAIQDFPYDHWRSKRGNRRAAVVELTVPYEVPNATDFIIGASIRNPDGQVSHLL